MSTAIVESTDGPDPVVDTGVRFVDLDEDGAIDFIRADQQSGDSARLSGMGFSDRVANHGNGSGGQVQVTYMKATARQNATLNSEAIADALAKGENVLPYSWSDRSAVATLTVSSLDVSATYSYFYAAPRWSLVERSSLGHRAAQITNNQDSTLMRSFFYQKHGRAGRKSRVEIYEAGALLRRATSDWEVVDGGSVTGSVPGTNVGRRSRRPRRASTREEWRELSTR
jgi:hypothetical protein